MNRIPTTGKGLVYVLPLMAGIIGFILIPAVMTFCLSLFQWSLSKPPLWVGPANYLRLLWGGGQGPDPLFLQALVNTLIIALVVPLQVGCSFFLALLLSRRMVGSQMLRIVVFLPGLVSPVALYILWRWVLNADFGLLTQLLGFFGLAGPAWLEDPFWSKPAVMMVMFWETVGGFQMLVFLAGVRQIPQQLFEMACLDGMGLIHKIRIIYLPWMKGLILFNLCLGTLGALQGGFEIACLMTGGGPLRSTTTLAYYLFENAFQWQKVGYGAAIGMVMFMLALPLLLIVRNQKRRLKN
ncbi:MAG: ABC transporter permease [Desulfobacterales bacterium]|nr:MAG: ABC transporter permease [Desulfobacterales bacterium]